jgi:hypothetical protein
MSMFVNLLVVLGVLGLFVWMHFAKEQPVKVKELQCNVCQCCTCYGCHVQPDINKRQREAMATLIASLSDGLDDIAEKESARKVLRSLHVEDDRINLLRRGVWTPIDTQEEALL